MLEVNIDSGGESCVPCGCLTPRAADLGYTPRYLDIYLAMSVSRFVGDFPLPPQAANASRWVAASEMDYYIIGYR